jgi:hypothetical protein
MRKKLSLVESCCDDASGAESELPALVQPTQQRTPEVRPQALLNPMSCWGRHLTWRITGPSSWRVLAQRTQDC